MNSILRMMLTNWLTSLPGGALLAHSVPALVEMVSGGANITTVLQSPVLGEFLSGLGLLLAKDMNVTGGQKSNVN